MTIKVDWLEHLGHNRGYIAFVALPGGYRCHICRLLVSDDKDCKPRPVPWWRRLRS